MAKSLEDLKASLKKIREDVAHLPPAPKRVEAARPVDLPPVPAAKVERPKAAAESAEPAQMVSDEQEEAEPLLRALLKKRVPEALFLTLASAGGFSGNRAALGVGLFGFLACVVLAAWTSSESRIDSDALDDLSRRLDGVERRLSNMAFSSDSGAVSRELEEEVRELRRILMSLMKALEEAPGPQGEPRGDDR